MQEWLLNFVPLNLGGPHDILAQVRLLLFAKVGTTHFLHWN